MIDGLPLSGSLSRCPAEEGMTRQRPKLFELLASERPDWDAVVVHLRDNPDDASYVDEETQQTALHLALARKKESRATRPRQEKSEFLGGTQSSSSEKRRRVIKTLLALHPDATSVRCKSRGYTPLAIACRTARLDDIADDAKVIRNLILSNQRSVSVCCRFGLTPILIHIKSVSRLKFDKVTLACHEPTMLAPDDDDENNGHEKRGAVTSFTAILDILARYSSQIQLEQALETAYQCNTLLILNLLSQEEASARRDMIVFGLKEARASSSLTGVWIWDWLLVILRHVSNRLGNKPRSYQGEVYPLHVASQITDCPPPVLLLCLRAFPQDARAVLDPTGLNLPIHQIASWTNEMGHSSCRRTICLKAIEFENPQVRNRQGESSLEPEVESSMLRQSASSTD
jgi:hypothetical protein